MPHAVLRTLVPDPTEEGSAERAVYMTKLIEDVTGDLPPPAEEAPVDER